MQTVILTNELLQSLIKTAKLITNDSDEDFDIVDASAGNFDNAYQLGVDDGEIYLARHILDVVGVDYENS
jgi:hypothetical protein